ncbi:NucA/NucB deoxyribonuclease domain-containing protein [Paenibacillus polymyxa]|uniref:NucA/NucB deoxyribonuclease domain-containing protein n=1 Tax=Paenibacillus polymyxa TaxID=1406 RepID=UPI002B41519E|nr:NucA/NucB deoxyribonuclease domain-containing protein [Paenibacillus polymyxa]WDZ59682.1 NucA/NucB deoxyribonuclease domain-containing protein [Paenibacillus polymyxa]
MEDFKEKALLTWELTSADTVKLEFPSAKYPETAQHIKQAIATGKSSVCTIDRDGANHNRDLSLKGVPTKKGKDRDEWPMAMCAEGGEGADIKYISPKDNRGAGSLVGHKLEEYKDGTKVEFIIK